MATDMGGFAQAGGPVLVDKFGRPLNASAPLTYGRCDFISSGGETVVMFTSPVVNLRITKNGLLLARSAYTINSTVSITLSTGLTTGDNLTVEAWSAYSAQIITLVPSPTDPLFANVAALLHFEGTNGSTTFTDVTGNTWTSSTSPSAVITTSRHAFGSSSGDFTGASPYPYITTPDAVALRIGTQDFCIEFQVNPSTYDVSQTIFSKGYVGAGDITIQTSATADLRFAVYIGGSTVCTESTGSYSVGSFHLIRVRRSGTAVTLERDGTVVASGTNSTNINNSTDPLCLGAAIAHSRSNPFRGYLDEFRLTIGSARSANAIQTAAWPDHA